mgnify:CR=1 FL=1
MISLDAVIGSNYGDEGKGALVHALCSHPQMRAVDLVIRHNGGPQAGHTVESFDGDMRHVFSTYGSGTFAGVPTYYAEAAFLYPPAISAEKEALVRLLGEKNVPALTCSPATKEILAVDIALCQLAEKMRDLSDPGRHGSCGMGVWEAEIRLAMRNSSRSMEEWFDKRAQQHFHALSFSTLENKAKARELIRVTKENLLQAGELEDVSTGALSSWVDNSPFSIYPEANRHYLAEGAQGLLLDQNDPDHQPHVTGSYTGVDNLLTMVDGRFRAPVCLENIWFVTRPYLTRHGRGPMLAAKDGEIEWENGPFQDKTNLTGPWQESVRYACLDEGKLVKRILKEAAKAWNVCPRANIHLAVSCESHVTRLFFEVFMAVLSRQLQFQTLLIPGQPNVTLWILNGAGPRDASSCLTPY